MQKVCVMQYCVQLSVMIWKWKKCAHWVSEYSLQIPAF